MNTAKSTRRQLLDALAELSQLRPQWRFGQTIANLAMTAGRLESEGIWDLEDEEALSAAKTLIEQSSEAGSPPSETSVVRGSR